MNKEILRLAIPAIVSNITIPLLGLCDTAISGHLGSASYIGAVSVGTTMLNVIFWLFGFLRMGTTGLTAGAYGAGAMRRSLDVLRKSLMVALITGLAIIILQNPLLDALRLLVGGERSVMEDASVYFNICIWGVPAQLTVMVVSGWFIGMQNTVVPMAIAIGMNILNMVASISLTMLSGVGFAGIAIGTLIANWIGAVVSLIILRGFIRKQGMNEDNDSGLCSINCKDKEVLQDTDSIRDRVKWHELFNVNGALLVRSACLIAVTLTVTAVGARFGATTLAGNAVMMQFFIFYSYFMDGFAYSGEALAGRYLGARDRQGLNSAVNHLLMWGAGVALLFTIIYIPGTEPITSLLTNQSAVIEQVTGCRHFVILLPVAGAAAFIFDGIFVGLTRTVAMMLSTFAGSAVFFVILFALPLKFDNTLLWIAFESYLLMRGLVLAVVLRHYMRGMKNLAPDRGIS